MVERVQKKTEEEPTFGDPNKETGSGLSWDSYSDHDLLVTRDNLKLHLDAHQKGELDARALKTLLEVYKITPDKISQTLERKIRETEEEIERRAQLK